MIKHADRRVRAICMYEEGKGFTECADMAEKKQSETHKLYITNAVVVNGAFACEMFLKALLTLREIQFKKKHNLRELFDVLPEDYQQYISNAVYARRWGEVNDCCGFPLLDNISNAFNEWRYWYDLEVANLRIDTAYLLTFQGVLQELCDRELKMIPLGGEG